MYAPPKTSAARANRGRCLKATKGSKAATVSSTIIGIDFLRLLNPKPRITIIRNAM
jgi:hypothetical protein